MSLDLAHLRIGPYRIHDVTTILLLATISTYLVVHFLQKFQLFSRPSTTDLERKSVATAKGKPERKPGGVLHLYPIRNLYLQTTTIHSLANHDCYFRMDPLGFQTTSCIPVPRLGRPHQRADPVSAI